MREVELSTLTIEAGDPIGETARKLIGALCAEMATRYGSPPSPFSRSEAAAPRAVFLVARPGGEAVRGHYPKGGICAAFLALSVAGRGGR